jgi:hypothetical protein
MATVFLLHSIIFWTATLTTTFRDSARAITSLHLNLPLRSLPTHLHSSLNPSCLPPRRRLLNFAAVEADPPTKGRPTRSRDSDEDLAVFPASKRARTARQPGAGAGDEGSAGEVGGRRAGGENLNEGADEDVVKGELDAVGDGAYSE